MDDLTLLRDLGRETPLPDPSRLARGRAALVAAATTEPATHSATPPAPLPKLTHDATSAATATGLTTTTGAATSTAATTGAATSTAATTGHAIATGPATGPATATGHATATTHGTASGPATATGHTSAAGAGVSAPPGGRGDGPRGRRRAGRMRWLAASSGLTAVAAAAALAVLLAPGVLPTAPGGTAQGPPGTAEPATPDGTGDPGGPAGVAAPAPLPVRDPGAKRGFGPGAAYSMRPASQVLALAAEAALAERDVAPRPDQFHYRGDVGPDGRPIYEIWKSIDGTHDGLVVRYDDPARPEQIPLDGCPADQGGDPGPKGKLPPEQGGGCDLDPAYLPDLPDDVAGLRAWLAARNTRDTAESTTNSTAKDIWDLAAAHHLRPAQRAALYRTAGTIPGLRVVDGATDAIGRRGTGVAWSFGGGSMMWVFDPRTYAYLGTPDETSRSALVDAVGQRP